MLTVLEQLPTGILDLSTQDLYRLLPGPTLIHLEGEQNPPLFVSVLLHGNEETGWLAMRALLRYFEGRRLPRALSLLIGNVEAARFNQRHLIDQLDFNRVWHPGLRAEHAMTQAVVAQMQTRGVFASIDIHNNTGLNPHYACVNRLEPEFLHLATLFSRTVVYFTRPKGVQSMAFASLAPAVALECGQSGTPYGVDHALEYLIACLHLHRLPSHRVSERRLDLFHTVATIKVPPKVSFGFGPGPEDLNLPIDLDHFNFRELPAQSFFGRYRPGSLPCLEVQDQTGHTVTEEYFSFTEGEIRTLLPLMPSMLTLNSLVIRQDCLGYLMLRYTDALPGQPLDDL